MLSLRLLHQALPMFFGKPSKPDDMLDIDDVIRRIDEGLDSIADADGRGTGEGQYIRGTMTLEDALLARDIADKLRRSPH